MGLLPVRELDWGMRPLPHSQRHRWLWPTLLVTGFLATFIWVARHDHSARGLSERSWLTLALAGLLTVLLVAYSLRGGSRQLLRALAEYATVALLVALLILPAGGQPHRVHQPPAAPPTTAAASQRNPAGDRGQPVSLGLLLRKLREAVADAAKHASDSAGAGDAPPPTTTTIRSR